MITAMQPRTMYLFHLMVMQSPAHWNANYIVQLFDWLTSDLDRRRVQHHTDASSNGLGRQVATELGPAYAVGSVCPSRLAPDHPELAALLLVLCLREQRIHIYVDALNDTTRYPSAIYARIVHLSINKVSVEQTL